MQVKIISITEKSKQSSSLLSNLLSSSSMSLADMVPLDDLGKALTDGFSKCHNLCMFNGLSGRVDS